jgi:hypothetical protein
MSQVQERMTLNDVLWRAFAHPGFRRRFYEEDTRELLTSLGLSEDEIDAFLRKDIDELMHRHHLFVRGPLRWGTYWLPMMIERAKRTKRTFDVEDALRLQEL